MAENNKITVELLRLSGDPHGRACLVCGAATMTSTFQFGNTALEMEICEPCQGKAAIIPLSQPETGQPEPTNV